MKMKREEDDNRNDYMLQVWCMPHVLFKSTILNHMWKDVTKFYKILTEKTKIVNDVRFIGPNWNTL